MAEFFNFFFYFYPAFLLNWKGEIYMIKSIVINLEVVESMLYYWSSVADREKVNESFFVDVANMDAMKLVQTEDFNEESIRKVLSSIQNRELLSIATKPEKRFWSKNMWIAEDVSVATKMAQPIKVLNVDDLVEKLNKEYPDFDQEKIVVHVAPLHREPYYIKAGQVVINLFMIYFDENDQALIDGQNIKDYIYYRLCELAKQA